MALRRMFSKNIIDTDRFIDMSAEARVLYFHLGMDADDDGFVGNPKSIMRIAGCRPEDMAELETQGYVAVFPSGVCAILHWREHNMIRRDRYTPTVYQEEFSLLYPEEEKPVDDMTTTMTTTMATTMATSVATTMATQDRLGKDRVGEEKKGQVSSSEEKKIKLSANQDSEGEFEGERAHRPQTWADVENLSEEEQRAYMQGLAERKRQEWQLVKENSICCG